MIFCPEDNLVSLTNSEESMKAAKFAIPRSFCKVWVTPLARKAEESWVKLFQSSRLHGEKYFLLPTRLLFAASDGAVLMHAALPHQHADFNHEPLLGEIPTWLDASSCTEHWATCRRREDAVRRWRSRMKQRRRRSQRRSRCGCQQQFRQGRLFAFASAAVCLHQRGNVFTQLLALQTASYVPLHGDLVNPWCVWPCALF